MILITKFDNLPCDIEKFWLDLALMMGFYHL